MKRNHYNKRQQSKHLDENQNHIFFVIVFSVLVILQSLNWFEWVMWSYQSIAFDIKYVEFAHLLCAQEIKRMWWMYGKEILCSDKINPIAPNWIPILFLYICRMKARTKLILLNYLKMRQSFLNFIIQYDIHSQLIIIIAVVFVVAHFYSIIFQIIKYIQCIHLNTIR